MRIFKNFFKICKVKVVLFLFKEFFLIYYFKGVMGFRVGFKKTCLWFFIKYWF